MYINVKLTLLFIKTNNNNWKQRFNNNNWLKIMINNRNNSIFWDSFVSLFALIYLFNDPFKWFFFLGLFLLIPFSFSKFHWIEWIHFQISSGRPDSSSSMMTMTMMMVTTTIPPPGTWIPIPGLPGAKNHPRSIPTYPLLIRLFFLNCLFFMYWNLLSKHHINTVHILLA